MSDDIVRFPHEGDLSELEAWIAGELGTCYARLFDSYVPWDPGNTVADYNEATFTGYAPINGISWGSPFINGDGKAETDSPSLTWTFTAGAGSTDVYGWMLTDSTGTKLLAVCQFVNIVTLTPGQPNLSRVIQVCVVGEV